MSTSDFLIVIRRFGAAVLLVACLLVAPVGQVQADTLPPTISIAFSSGSIVINSEDVLTFTITNPNSATTLLGVSFQDNLPAGLVVSSPGGVTTACGGTLVAVAMGSVISLTGGSDAGGMSCIFSVDVTGISLGFETNTTGAVSSTNGGTGTNSNSATVEIVPFTTAPEPGTICLLGSGLVGLGVLKKRIDRLRPGQYRET